MLRIKNVIISESNSVDKDTGNVSIFNIFTDISAPAFPVVMGKVVVTIILERDEGEASEGTVELLIKQKNVPDTPRSIPYAFKETNGANLIIRINNLVITGPGKIEFVVKCGKTETKNTLSVIKAGVKI